MVAELRRILRESTGTLGVRVTTGERWPAARTIESVWIDGQLIRIKVSAGRVKAEHDDVALAARRTGQTLREVAFRAEALWRSNHQGPRMTVTPDGGGGWSDGDARVDRGWPERSPSPLEGDDDGMEPA
jgi:hypothetical protein